MLPRLIANTLVDDCYRSLKTAILKLDLEPGTPLVEASIASQMGISKTPVREALAQLATEGLVTTEPSRRSYVAGLTVESVREIYQVRLLLESSSLRRVTALLTEEDLARLNESIEKAATALQQRDRDQFTVASQQFHSLLIARSGNQCLIDISQRLFEQAGRMRVAIYRTEEMSTQHVISQQGINNHRHILEALVARDGDQAAARMSADLQMFLDLYETPTIRAALTRLNSRAEIRDGAREEDR